MRDARKRAGLSQGELARQAGLHPTYISHVESGRRSSARTRWLASRRSWRCPWRSCATARTPRVPQRRGRARRGPCAPPGR
ncbi:helix-turn-helix transcriptional regulator [Cellulomonas soli]